ncbi:hypothetical protein ABH920_004554 [Catenulispora sp. EB89]|uniref:hypothetical protein n=1 Tax=Catenulispora sp. EB89 TaxID=3156257 RepID=UPI00351534BE
MSTKTGIELGAEAARRLRRWGAAECEIEPGLTDEEFARIEDEFGFRFADDHRAFLAAGLPVSVPYDDPPGVLRAWAEPWPDWRDGDRAALRRQVAWPLECVENYVEHYGFWLEEWGPRPEALEDALSVARKELAEVPVLVPVYAHRFLPAGRGTHGHPVLSVYHTDTIYYGADLAEWVLAEFADEGADEGADEPAPDRVPESPQATVRFWRDVL